MTDILRYFGRFDGYFRQARDDLIAPLSYLIALKLGKNRYATLREEFRQEFEVGQNKCPALNEIGDGEEYQIDLLRLALPIVFTLLFSSAGVAWYFLDKAGKCVTRTKDDDDARSEALTEFEPNKCGMYLATFRLKLWVVWDRRRSTDITQNPVGLDESPQALELDEAVADIYAAVEKLRARSND